MLLLESESSLWAILSFLHTQTANKQLAAVGGAKPIYPSQAQRFRRALTQDQGVGVNLRLKVSLSLVEATAHEAGLWQSA